MRRTHFFAAILISSLATLLSSCGGANNSQLMTGSPVSLTMRDAPPVGVTVLSFEITVTGALLEPGDVPLVNKAITVEVEKLQTETAFLNTANAQPGVYNSIALTFANPELTILNKSGSPIGNCADGAVCELKPALSQGSVMYSASPFPLTLTSNTPVGLLLDFDLNASIQTDLSVTPTITLTQLPAVQGTGELEDLEEVMGQVTGKDTDKSQFTLQTDATMSLTIDVNGSTEFEGFDEIGLANSFSSVTMGQNLEVDLGLMSGGALLAKKVELKENANGEEVEGTVVSVDSPTQFKVVALDEMPDIAGMEVGNVVTVAIQSGASFRVDADGLTLPSDVIFNGSADLLVGQNVEVRLISGSSGTSVTTDRLTLKMSQFPAKVASVNGSNFTVNNLPTLFTGASPAITEINVVTTMETEFEDVANVTALNSGDPVSLRGLLFKTTASPELVARKVRKR